MNNSNKSFDFIRPLVQLILVVALLTGGYFGYLWFKSLKPEPKKHKRPVPIPMVRVELVTIKDYIIHIHGQGTVKPWREIKFAPQVGGKVKEISPCLVNGGSFKKGDILVRIDSEDYLLAVTLAKARIKDSESKLQLIEQEAKIARLEWEMLYPPEENPDLKPPPLVVKTPQLAAARAKLEADKADLQKALLQLDRTRLAAPFNGQVSEKMVDAGQFVSPGQVLAILYSIEAAQIIAPLEDKDLFWFDVPGFTQKKGKGSPAIIRAKVAGRELSWRGQVERSEGEVDESTRTVRVVVKVDKPYATLPPLARGLFVNVDIQGRTISNSAMISRAALRDGQIVWVVNKGILSFKKVEVARVSQDGVLVTGGLRHGDMVVVSSLNAPADNMKVRVPGGNMKKPEQEGGS